MPSTISSVWTIGHSTRALDEFLALLTRSSIGLVADVRKLPGSTRYPHFNAEPLSEALSAVGISYRHYPELGGRRGRRAADSPNTGWRVEAFNAFADHMASDEFTTALDDLTARAHDTRTVLMCSEAVPWRCHRRLIADAVTVRGWSVFDILSARKVVPHRLTDFARVDGTSLTYPSEPLFAVDEGSDAP
jgi:uncharacterized protein (DUF488 family)